VIYYNFILYYFNSKTSDLLIAFSFLTKIGSKWFISATQYGFNLEDPINNNGSFIFSAQRRYLDFIFKLAGPLSLTCYLYLFLNGVRFILFTLPGF